MSIMLAHKPRESGGDLLVRIRRKRHRTQKIFERGRGGDVVRHV